MKIFNTFVRSVVSQIGRDTGRLISKILFNKK